MFLFLTSSKKDVTFNENLASPIFHFNMHVYVIGSSMLLVIFFYSLLPVINYTIRGEDQIFLQVVDIGNLFLCSIAYLIDACDYYSYCNLG